MASGTCNTTFLVLSNTHGFETDSENSRDLSRVSSIPVHVLLHCGDLTQVGGLSAFRQAIRTLGQFDAELKLVIAGNHDLELDKAFWTTHLEEKDDPEDHEKAVEIMTGELAEEANVTGIPVDVDIVMTHGPPLGILDNAAHQKPDEDVGCRALLNAVSRTRPLIQCFGHIHEGYGYMFRNWEGGEASGGHHQATIQKVRSDAAQDFDITRGQQTLMIKAAITDEKNRPNNSPWIVELELLAAQR